MIQRARFVLAASVLAALPSARGAAQNVLVVVLDDVGVEFVGCYDQHFQSQGMPPGNPALTLALDRLVAAGGMMFTQAWSCPTCSPSRAAMLTGRMPSSTGIGHFINDHALRENPGLSPTETLLPEVLHAAPDLYTCAALGKWHLVRPPQVASDLRHPLGQPNGRWFDRYAGTLFGVKKDPTVPETQTGYFAWQKTYASYVELAVDPCSPKWLPCNVSRSVPPIENYATVDTSDDALALLQELPEPWFLYLSFNACHEPMHDVPGGLPTVSCQNYAPPTPCDTSATPTVKARVRCMLQALDTQLARVLCAVDDTDTTVIVVGDNGGQANTVMAPYVPGHGKGTVYEGGVRVPLLVRSPRIPPGLVGTKCDALVSVADVFATVCELAGTAAPASAADSLSLLPLLEGYGNLVRHVLYTEGFFPNFEPDALTGEPPVGYRGQRHLQAVRDVRFKLLRKWTRSGDYPGTINVAQEFYDLTEGGPPDTSTIPPTPRPDFFEQYELFSSGEPLPPGGAAAYFALSAELDARPPVVQ